MMLSAPIFRLKRRAKLLARAEGIPLHRALDKVAGEEGFRSWSHLAASSDHPAGTILSQLDAGDLVLLGARPGHGKTILGLELVIEATRRGQRGFFFTLDFNESDGLGHLRSLGADPKTIDAITLDASDDICADHVIRRLSEAPRRVVAVIDYLQLLDQRRQNPELAEQIRALKVYAGASGSIIVVISQIDRSFELRAKRLPELSDVRLPNPLDLTLFTKSCFLHEGRISVGAVT
jgi:replicative DNA helicase